MRLYGIPAGQQRGEMEKIFMFQDISNRLRPRFARKK